MQTLTEKLLARASERREVQPGEIVVIEPDVVLSHDNTATIATIFRQLPQGRVKYPDRLAITLDHAVPPPTAKHAQNHARIRDFVREQGNRQFLRSRARDMPSGALRRRHRRAGYDLARRGQPQPALWVARRFRHGHWGAAKWRRFGRPANFGCVCRKQCALRSQHILRQASAARI